MAAVSKSVTPRSIARWTARISSWSSTSPYWLPPISQQPKPIAEISRSDVPIVRYCIAASLASYPRLHGDAASVRLLRCRGKGLNREGAKDTKTGEETREDCVLRLSLALFVPSCSHPALQWSWEDARWVRKWQ